MVRMPTPPLEEYQSEPLSPDQISILLPDTRLRRQWNTASHVGHLPVELLVAVFEETLDLEETSLSDYYPRLFWLAHTCSFWRDTIFNTPRLWTVLSFSAHPELRALALERAGNLTLRAYLNENTPRISVPHDALLSERWKTSHLVMVKDTRETVDAPLPQNLFPQGTNDGSSDQLADDFNGFGLLHRGNQALEVKLSRPVWVDHPAFTNLTELKVGGPFKSGHGYPVIADPIGMLLDCPNLTLVSLFLPTYESSDQERCPTSHLPLVLPSLKKFHVDGCAWDLVVYLKTNIRAPNCDDFFITGDVQYDPKGEPTYAESLSKLIGSGGSSVVPVGVHPVGRFGLRITDDENDRSFRLLLNFVKFGEDGGALLVKEIVQCLRNNPTVHFEIESNPNCAAFSYDDYHPCISAAQVIPNITLIAMNGQATKYLLKYFGDIDPMNLPSFQDLKSLYLIGVGPGEALAAVDSTDG